MSKMSKTLVGILMLLVFGLTGCDAIPLDNDGGASVPSFGANQNTPQITITRFMDNWQAGDYQSMYNDISEQSRQRYSFEAFERFYISLANDIGLSDLTYTLDENTHLQGTSAAINYTLTLQSELFGEIVDDERIIRLVNENDQWRVAWSSMDIFEGYTDDSVLTVQTERQRRANIYDRNGDVLVAENGTVSVLFAQQSLMNNVVQCQSLLADLMYTPLTQLRADFAGYLPETVFYVGEIDEFTEVEYSDRLRETCGMTRDNNLIVPRQTRQYVLQGGAVHATGYIGPIPQEPESEKNRWLARGYDENDLIGRYGVELAYETQLAGRPPRVLRITDPSGVVLRDLGRVEGTPPQSVYLTLDRDIQTETARAVAWGFNYASNNWAAPGISPGGSAIAIDVNSGAILGMTSFPTFQPGLFNPDSFAPNRGERLAQIVNSPRQPTLNRVTQEQFSPGSIFKIVSTAAIVDAGMISPQSIFYCGLTWDGSRTYGDTFSPRSDWRLTDGLDATGDIVPSQALTSSCDPFYYEFGAKLYREIGPNVVVDYAHMMGFDGPSGIGIYPEARGNIPVPQSVEEAINNAIGQGDTQVTLIQAAMMTAAVANGGIVYKPYIVQQVGDGANAEIVGQPEVLGTVDWSPEVLEMTRQGMCDVVADDDKGTAYWIFNDNVINAPYQACGKTGTAQAGYAPHAWFVAYAPADDPQVAVVAMAQNSREGSEVAAPMVRRILDAYFETEITPFPGWWQNEYVPLEIPTGGVAGG